MKKKLLLLALMIIFVLAITCLLAGCGFLFGNGNGDGGDSGNGGGGGGFNDDDPYDGKVWWLYCVDVDGNKLYSTYFKWHSDIYFVRKYVEEKLPTFYVIDTMTFADGTPMPLTNEQIFEYLNTHDPDDVQEGTAVYTVTVKSKASTRSVDFYVDGSLYLHYDVPYDQWETFTFPEVPEKENYIGIWTDERLTKFADTKILAFYRVLYTIRTPDDWSLLAEHKDANFRLANDINFLGGAIPITSEFSGTLDGQGHKVSNFINQNPAAPNVYGLFATNSGTIKNITFTGGVYTVSTVAPPNLNTTNRVGLIAGFNKGTLSNVTLDDIAVKITCYDSTEKWGTNLAGITTNSYAGVLCGLNEGAIDYCAATDSVNAHINSKMYVNRDVHYTATIKTFTSFGLIVGANKGTVSHATAEGALNSSAERSERHSTYGDHYDYVHYILRAGGVVGANLAAGVVSDSVSSAAVIADFVSAKTDVDNAIVVHHQFFGIVDIGGIAGVSSGQIERCVVTDEATLYSYAEAETRMGGLVGTNDTGATLRASYTQAQLSVGNRSATEKTYCGGIAGLNSGAITYCYAIADSLEVLAFEDTVAYFGGLFGHANDEGTIVNSFAKVAVQGLFSNNVCGSYNLATVTRCYVYLTEEAANFAPCSDVTACDTESALLTAIGKLGFDAMGFTVSAGAYPTLPNVGNVKQ